MDVNNNELPVVDQAALDQETFKEFAQLLDENGNLPAGSTSEKPEKEDTDDVVAQAAEEGGKPEEPAPTSKPDDAFSSATPDQKRAFAELQAEYARLQHAENSNRHRVSALTKKLVALEEQAKAAPAAAAAPEEQADDGTDLTQFQADFPEVFAAMNALHKREIAGLRKTMDAELGELKQKFAGVEQPFNDMAAAKETEYRTAQYNALTAVHPDFKVIQDTPEFWGWLEHQTPGIKQLVSSSAADDNIALLDLYKKTLPAGSQESAGSGKPNRPRDAEGGSSLPRSGTGRLDTAPTDGDAMWDYWAKQANQNRI